MAEFGPFSNNQSNDVLLHKNASTPVHIKKDHNVRMTAANKIGYDANSYIEVIEAGWDVVNVPSNRLRDAMSSGYS